LSHAKTQAYKSKEKQSKATQKKYKSIITSKKVNGLQGTHSSLYNNVNTTKVSRVKVNSLQGTHSSLYNNL